MRNASDDGGKATQVEREIRYLVEQLEYASGERRISARAKLELVKVRREAEVVHEQGVFVPIVCHFVSYFLKVSNGDCRWGHPSSRE